MDEEIRQALNEVREMKQMCGNINMKLTNIVTQRGQNWKAKLEAEYQRGFEDGKAVNGKGCEGCKYEGRDLSKLPCMVCSNSRKNCWTAKQTDDEIKVGDEVEISQSDENGVWVVIKVEKHDDYEAYCAINKDGDIYFEEEQDRVTKTGRHFDISSILKEMQS